MYPELNDEETKMLIVVEVRYDPAEGILALSQPEQSRIELTGPQDRVQWLVTGCPNDCYPEVRFQVDGSQPSALGPFNGLRASASYILSDGIVGAAGVAYPYVLQVKKIAGSGSQPSETVAELPGLEVLQTTAETHDGLSVTVSPLGGGRLKVDPEFLHLLSGDSVTWTFEGLSEDPSWSPQVVFFSAPEGSLQQNPRFGPFTSLCTRGNQVVGTGNNRVLGNFGYVVSVVDAASGGVLRSKIKDPGMANDGDPPGGAGP